MTNTGSANRRRRIKLGSFQDDLCFYCGEPMIYLPPAGVFDERSPVHQAADVASFDHYIPRDQGGSGCRENTVMAHRGCNSRLKSTTKNLDDKLRALNVRRGYGDAEGNVPRSTLLAQLRPDAFGLNSPALQYLCDEANAIDGREGNRVRKHITRRLIAHIDLLNGLKPIKDANFRQNLITAMVEHRQANYQSSLPQLLQTLLDNVTQTMSKRNVRGEDDDPEDDDPEDDDPANNYVNAEKMLDILRGPNRKRRELK